MRPRDLCILLTVVAAWGLNFVVIKWGLREITPFSLCFARFFFTSIPAIFFIKPPAAPFHKIATYGLIMFALQFSLLFIGMNVGMPAGMASVLLQTNVFFTMLLSVIFLNEKPSLYSLLGALVSFSGIALIGSGAEGEMTVLGFALVISAAFFWGMGNLLSKKIGKVDMLALVVWGSLVAWPPLLLVTLFTEGEHQLVHDFSHMSLSGLGSIAYIVIFATLFGFGTWNRLLTKYPMSTISPFTLLVPVFGIFSASLLLGESISSKNRFAIGLVIIGLLINLTVNRFKQMKLNSAAESGN